MKTLRTTLDLRNYDVRRLMHRGYQIEYIETRHEQDRDETLIVWTRQSRADELIETEIPF